MYSKILLFLDCLSTFSTTPIALKKTSKLAQAGTPYGVPEKFLLLKTLWGEEKPSNKK